MAERGAHWYLPPPGIPHRPGESYRLVALTCSPGAVRIRDGDKGPSRTCRDRHDRLFVSEASRVQSRVCFTKIELLEKAA